jgi:hypothetical protein
MDWVEDDRSNDLIYEEMIRLQDLLFKKLTPKEKAALFENFEEYLNLTILENEQMEMDSYD